MLLTACSGGEPLPGTLTVDRSDVAFGEVPVETSAQESITLENTGDEPVELYSVTFADGDRDVWRLDGPEDTVLEGGETALVVVTFAPEAVQDEAGRIQIRHSDEATGNLLVGLAGIGTPSIADDDEDGYSPADGDCDDGRDDVYPGAPELCDGRDNDCDGIVPADEANDDSDAYRICEGDCDDTDGDVYPGAPEICDDKDSDCSGDGNTDHDDVDGDGVSVCEGDCDDGDDQRFPDNPETCDGVDNDCNQVVDDLDADGDGHSLCHPAGDCDDGDEFAYPVVVDASVSPGGDGTDEDPFATIDAALANLDGTCNEVFLLDGTHAAAVSLGAGDQVAIRGQSVQGAVIEAVAGDPAFSLADGADLYLQDLTITGADVQGSDGGALQVVASSATLQDVVLRDNACQGDGGGAVVKSDGSLTLLGALFDGNEAIDDGGAVALISGTLTDQGSTYRGNTGNEGGAIYASGGSLALYEATFDGNQADEGGGALYVTGSSTLDLWSSVFWRNAADEEGGAISIQEVDDPDGDVRRNRFQNNTAGTNGGAVAFGGQVALVVANNTMTVNEAGTEGAHVYVGTGDVAGLQVISNIGHRGNVGQGGSGFFAPTGSGGAVTYSLVFGTSGTDFGGDLSAGTGSNLSQNPLFTTFTDDADPTDDVLVLEEGSPAIDTGPPDMAWDDPDGSQNDRGWTGGPAAPTP